MKGAGPVTLTQVEMALENLGGEAQWEKILAEVSRIRNGDYSHYLNKHNYENTAFQIVQQHCPGYKKFKGPQRFEKVGSAYRLRRSQSEIATLPKALAEKHSPRAADIEEPSQTGIKKSKIVSEDEESKFPEGKEKFKLHKSFERDSGISKKAKELRLDQVGELRCDVCSFSFSDAYGEHGAGFIEAHHTAPVAELNGERKTKIEEIALVCSNCHRMLHLGDYLLTVEELKAIISEQNQASA